MENLQLVICDIDNTLVSPLTHEMQEYTKEVIRKLHAHGVHFGLASGRPLDEIEAQVKRWGLEKETTMLLGLNGCQLWDGNNHSYHSYYLLETAWIKEILELMEPFDLNPYMYLDGGRFLATRMDEMVQYSADKVGKTIVLVDDKSEFYKEKNAKIMFRIDEDKMPEIEAYVKQHESSNYKAFKTQTTMLEFANSNVSKAFAMKEYCKRNHIDVANVMAFGDMSNDNDMLEASGLGVCLLNGSKDTKAIADVITEKTCDEEGFAHFIETHVFTPKGW
ncbi:MULTISPECIES: HAD family hydrolase [unclassified Breznakia]|uniref:HAD family hydrolase n=1 Tax=unclassified Breznakia TaxID=2623764 RepID=UPI002475A224|nr:MULTISPECIES: HAD family hydrolase [unclassified Breznakia]MDH6366381.1 Cof subfamily protein (haloacid dehalogenase superfamily) [Breznakia sp. PH1-1]MDH6403474.1 Cof subfamily protein (haloacid dehalogenase superfamily) [Breznakia sp. PF1-11]MDH6411183.1 Cof subfamily protein (haloacid dehalogenase superfamily) [Breznakia sp. PFB1-11]MDH6413554.1 Cof subfamily protein (haloacid dehalogenase superfamily) [Breznakia sp. PFB1-14]MDH6415728.1 Cof subfamily protein (haloacid dehalogenase super